MDRLPSEERRRIARTTAISSSDRVVVTWLAMTLAIALLLGMAVLDALWPRL